MDLCVLDTETLGVHPNAPVWEVGCIRRSPEGEVRLHLFVRHNPRMWLASLPEQFADDYRARYDHAQAVPKHEAALTISAFLADTQIIGAVPNFDTERISAQLLRPHNIADPWHYHLLDVGNLAVGWLAGRASLGDTDAAAALPKPGEKWSSDTLSELVGVDPGHYKRHTAMGDAEWTLAQYDAITGAITGGA